MTSFGAHKVGPDKISAKIAASSQDSKAAPQLESSKAQQHRSTTTKSGESFSRSVSPTKKSIQTTLTSQKTLPKESKEVDQKEHSTAQASDSPQPIEKTSEKVIDKNSSPLSKKPISQLQPLNKPRPNSTHTSTTTTTNSSGASNPPTCQCKKRKER